MKTIRAVDQRGDSASGRLKGTELLSSLGAGVLGAGMALLFSDFLVTYAIPILVLGLVSHAVGMSHKHSLENRGDSTRLWWVEALYWLCWLSLAAVAVFVLLSSL